MATRTIGFIIAHDNSPFYDLYFAEIQPNYILKLGTKINPKRHFKTYQSADGYAQRYFKHLRLAEFWTYVGNFTCLETFPTNHQHRDHSHRRRYKNGIYYTISHKKRGTPKKYRWTNKYVSRVK